MTSVTNFCWYVPSNILVFHSKFYIQGTTAAVAAGNVSNELERHDEDDDDQDNLFTSSIDTTSSVVSKGGKSKHKHKNKASRSDSQVSNSSSKSGHKEKKAASNKNGESWASPTS